MMQRFMREFWVAFRADLLKMVRHCDKQVAKIDGASRKEMLESNRHQRVAFQQRKSSQKTWN